MPNSTYTCATYGITKHHAHEKQLKISKESGDGMSLQGLGWDGDVYYTPEWGWPWKVRPDHYDQIMREFKEGLEDERSALGGGPTPRVYQSHLMNEAVEAVFIKRLKWILKTTDCGGQILDIDEIYPRTCSNLKTHYRENPKPNGFRTSDVKYAVRTTVFDVLRQRTISGSGGTLSEAFLQELGWNGRTYFHSKWGWPWIASDSTFQRVMEKFTEILKHNDIPMKDDDQP